MDQGGGLEAIALGFIFHVPAGHQAQFRIDVLRQPDQGGFVTAAPGFQQKCDFVRTRVDGLPPVASKIYKKRGRFWASAAACTCRGRGNRILSCRNGANMIMKHTTAKVFVIAAITALAMAIAPMAKAKTKDALSSL